MKLPKIANKEPVVAYARFSSEGQRDESIDAQMRAISEYADKNNMRIIHEYIDKAKTATNDNRPEFQNMVSDSERKRFKKILVHKPDRFSRDNLLSLMYIDQFLNKGIKVVSVTEQFDDSPSGEFMRNIMLAQGQMFSRNLAQEVEKGKKKVHIRVCTWAAFRL